MGLFFCGLKITILLQKVVDHVEKFYYFLVVSLSNSLPFRKIKIIGDLPMKRQKRDRLDRAHSQGYKAGISGRSRDACPYQSSDSKSQWLGGWREAIDDKNVGLFK